ncbi:MAG: DMT family transporter [Moraxellaceae bacterium]|nr:DMT family transporter [Moraxellaceae bacterium]
MTNAGKADLMLVGVTLLAAMSWIFSREAVLLMPPLLFMAIRFLLAAALLAAIGHAQLRALDAHSLRRAVLVGLVFAAGMSLWVMGIFLGTHVGEGAFLTSLGVVMVPVLGRLVFGEKQPRSTWIALPVAASGLALLSLQHGFRPEPGQLCYVVAACIFALYYTLNTHAANTRTQTTADGQAIEIAKVPALALTAVVLATVGVFTTVLSLAFEPWQPSFTNFSVEMVAWIVASAVIGTAARFLLQTHAQSLSLNTHGVVIMVVEPVWVALLAAGWFGESMNSQQLAGCALIFLALLINRAETLKHWLKAVF